MKKISLIIFIAAIMVVGVLGTNYVSDADVIKSKNDASLSTDICGLMLCSDYPGGKAVYQDIWSTAFRSYTSVPVSDHSNDHSEESSTSKIVPSSHNADQEFSAQLDVFIHKFELDKISADEALEGITEAHYGFVDLYITSNLVESIDVQLNIYESGTDSASHVLHEIHEVIEEEELVMEAALLSVDGEVMVKELPPNTVDMPIGAGVPGCETNNMCYTPTHLTVHPGTTVTWINSDGSIPHTVTAGWVDSESIGLDYPGGNGFDSDFMSGGAEFEHTFEVPGEYDYYCQLHPWMIGSITVE